jgi:hypothetical protein
MSNPRVTKLIHYSLSVADHALPQVLILIYALFIARLNSTFSAQQYLGVVGWVGLAMMVVPYSIGYLIHVTTNNNLNSGRVIIYSSINSAIFGVFLGFFEIWAGWPQMQAVVLALLVPISVASTLTGALAKISRHRETALVFEVGARVLIWLLVVVTLSLRRFEDALLVWFSMESFFLGAKLIVYRNIVRFELLSLGLRDYQNFLSDAKYAILQSAGSSLFVQSERAFGAVTIAPDQLIRIVQANQMGQFVHAGVGTLISAKLPWFADTLDKKAFWRKIQYWKKLSLVLLTAFAFSICWLWPSIGFGPFINLLFIMPMAILALTADEWHKFGIRGEFRALALCNLLQGLICLALTCILLAAAVPQFLWIAKLGSAIATTMYFWSLRSRGME